MAQRIIVIESPKSRKSQVFESGSRKPVCPDASALAMWALHGGKPAARPGAARNAGLITSI
jgi:hypothetical protein